eukprot:3251935-Amphidinium_carterae.1
MKSKCGKLKPATLTETVFVFRPCSSCLSHAQAVALTLRGCLNRTQSLETALDSSQMAERPKQEHMA